LRRIVLLLSLTFLPLFAEELPRTMIAIYDSHDSKDIEETVIHQAAEMPLNHLGIKLNYVDICGELPDAMDDPDVLGVIVWSYDWKFEDKEIAEKFLRWASKMVDAGKKYIAMGLIPFEGKTFEIDINERNDFWKKLGLKDTTEWISTTYDSNLIYNCPELFHFERHYPEVLPTYLRMVKLGNTIDPCLMVRQKDNTETDSVLVGIGERGSYVAANYPIYWRFRVGKAARAWYFNPFDFFEKALGLEGRPRPDTTTLFGRRIFYSHIDGDGWNNYVYIRKYRNTHAIAARVLLNEVLEPYSDLAFTVGPVGAEIDFQWAGTKKSIPCLKEIVELENVELGCHTFSHPFDWAFFKNYVPQDEYPYLHLYPNGTWMGAGAVAWMKLFVGSDDPNVTESHRTQYNPNQLKQLNEIYDMPRAYARKPFELDREVEGAVSLINKKADSEKKVKAYLWSGDCRPFYAAVKKVADAGIPNINGGDTRFDTKFDSYAWVMPLGRQVKDLWQIYSSNSNENTYTDYWEDDFYAFNLLVETLKNTEFPIRIKPMNLYYHVYSAERTPGLRAVLKNIAYIRSQEIIPIFASEYSMLAQGFYTLKMSEMGKDSWMVEDRGDLQTIRFDYAVAKGVDFAKSEGVIGQVHYQGSLYAALDPGVKEPVIALKDLEVIEDEPREPHYYLIQSRWQMKNIEQVDRGIEFDVMGHGPLEMCWNVPEEGEYLLSLDGGQPVTFKSENQQLEFSLPQEDTGPLRIKIVKKS